MPSFARLACTGLLVALIGCGGSGQPKTVQVGGAVTLDGKPLSNVYVIFASADKDGAPQNYYPVDNGRFTAALPAGKYRVTFRPKDFLGTEPTGPVGSDFGSNPGLKASKSPLPDKYREKAIDTIDATNDRTDLDFKLTTK
jgi:hypothetical protein